MATKRIIRPAGTEAAAEQITGPSAGTEAEQIDAELDGLAQQLPEGAIATLYRFCEGADKEFVDEMLVVDFSLATVKQRYGGGRYILFSRVPDPNVGGKYFRHGSKRFRIAGPPITAPPAAAPAAAGNAGGIDAQRVLASYAEMIQAQVKSQLQGAEMLQTMQMAVLKNLTERPADPSIDLMKTILPALIQRSGGGTDLAGVIALAERLANKSGPAASLKETLDLLRSARDFASGSDGDTPPWLGLASKGLETIAKVIDHNRDATPAPLALAPGAAAEPVAAATDTPLVPTDQLLPEGTTLPPNVHPIFSFLAPRIRELVTHAALDHDPTSYAGILADLIPEIYAAGVLEKIAEPGFIGELVTIFPMTAPYAPWFTELRDELADRLTPEPEQPPAPPAPGA